MTKHQHQWTTKELPTTVPESMVAQLSKEVNISEILARVLCNRGITSYDQARAYFRPQATDLHDPFLMDGMNAAVDRVLLAVSSHEKIMVYGDYDVDGTTSVSMLTLFFQSLELDTAYYIPDRIKEGYGISKYGIDKANELGIKLLIAIDCGITAIEQTEYARSLGIDVIICDHHQPESIIPNAVAVLDPLKPGCKYPFKSLCGCGVGFKLIQGITRKLGKDELALEYLDFVTIATAADIVPIIGENRVLTKLGLERINVNPRPGIRALVETCGLSLGKISTGQIVFVLAPRINAVGRLGDAMRAVHLMMSKETPTISQLANVLEEENRNRRKIDEETFAHAQKLAEELLSSTPSPAIVLHHELWHPGVIGIVASRLVEKYYRPTVMMTTVDGVAKGSARSISGFDIHAAIKRVEDKVLQFGGHKYAAGLSVALDKVDEFRVAFNSVVNELMTDDIRTPEIQIDGEITLSDITPRFLRILKEFAPFGPGNMRPMFLIKNVEVAGVPKIVGKNHLRFKIRQNRLTLDAIGFGLGSYLDKVQDSDKPLDIVFSVDEHERQSYGSTSSASESFPQLKVKDLRTSEVSDPIEEKEYDNVRS